MELANLFDRQDHPRLVRTSAASVQPGDEVVWVTCCDRGLAHHHATQAAYTVIDSDHRRVRIVGPVDEHALPCDHPVLVLRDSGRLLQDITPET